MRIVRYLTVCVLSFGLAIASTPVRNLSVTFVGKKYDVDSATTVEEIQQQVQSQADDTLGPELPHVVFAGKRLKPSAILSDEGVGDGSELNLVYDQSSIQDMLEGSGLDKEKIGDLLKSMGGMGGGVGEDGKMPSLKESMDMMSSMINSPIFQEYMSDPEQLEKSRQMILTNPMLKSVMGGMPGMESLLNSPEAWRESMQAAAGLYQNMDTKDLMKAMMGGGDSLNNLSGKGLFDGILDNPASSALDELSEGED